MASDGEWDNTKDRMEQNVEDFPEDAARWTGDKVGEVEAIPDNIEEGFDRFGDKIRDGYDDVVDAPENAANWVSASS